jgi:hypothetical protein
LLSSGVRRTPLTLAVLVVASLLLSGCSSPEPEATTATSNAPVPTPRRPVVGASFTLTGKIDTPTERPIELQKYKSGKWQLYAKGTTQASGAYSFTASTTAPERRFRVHAPAVDAAGGASALSEFTSDERVVKTGSHRTPSKLGAHILRIKTHDGSKPSMTTVRPGSVSIDGAKPVALDTVNLRGSSTARLEKKPYRLRFAKKIDLFNMGEGDHEVAGKNFNLLASFQDPSLIRDKVGLDLGAQLSGLRWTPRNTFTEVIVNGEYMGSYLATESIKIDERRVDIDDEKGLLLEVDGYHVSATKFGFKSAHHEPITFKDPDEIKKDDPDEGYTPAKLKALKSQVARLENVLYAAPAVRDNPSTGWRRYVDLDSAIDYYLVKEFTKDNDSDFYRSNFFSWSDYTNPSRKFVFGPVWDFDRGAGVDTDQTKHDKALTSPRGWWMRGNTDSKHYNHETHWFVQMAKDPAFQAALRARWAKKKSVFKAVFTSKVKQYGAQLAVAGVNDRERWGGHRRYKNHADSTQGEIDWVAGWYRKRYAWMDSQLS